MNYKNLFYFDIETVSKYKNLEDFQKNDLRGYNLFLRKIDRKSENFSDWKIDPQIVYKNKASLIPEFGKIICISMAYFKNDELKIKSLYDDNEEFVINESHKLFTYVSNNTTMGLCGYYIKGFDIPWLNRKMIKYGLKIPNILRTFKVKPWDSNVFDLAEIWKSNGTLENTSFDEMLYELSLDSPKEDISGENVNKTYWEDDDLLKIKEYCENDVRSNVDAAKRLTGII